METTPIIRNFTSITLDTDVNKYVEFQASLFFLKKEYDVENETYLANQFVSFDRKVNMPYGEKYKDLKYLSKYCYSSLQELVSIYDRLKSCCEVLNRTNPDLKSLIHKEMTIIAEMFKLRFNQRLE